jgi:hypothetical protein
MDVDFTMFPLARGSFLVVYGPFVYPYTMDVDLTMFPLARGSFLVVYGPFVYP